MRRVAAAHGLRTVGDYLEFRYSPHVRGVDRRAAVDRRALHPRLAADRASAGSSNVVAGMPKPVGCALGGLVITVYFSAGGLLTSAWVNVVQLTVKLVGFALALPLALAAAGGWDGAPRRCSAAPGYWSFWRGDASGLVYLALLGAGVHRLAGPAAEDLRRPRRPRGAARCRAERARPVRCSRSCRSMLGIIARRSVPGLAGRRIWRCRRSSCTGCRRSSARSALAAVFSAEVSAADAVLFMLTTSLSQDLYKRFINPAAATRSAGDRARGNDRSAARSASRWRWSSADVDRRR